jgi:glycosyltransferase involved in cell wall biosynthesis
MSAMNAQMVAVLAEQLPVRVINVRPNGHVRGALYHATKSVRALLSFPRLLDAWRKGARAFYASVDEGAGALWLIQHLSIARALGMRIYLHHHSYRYVTARRNIMAGVMRVAGPHASHIVLCEDMAEQLRARYPDARRFVIAPNPVEIPGAILERSEAAAPFTIGMMANLTFEKGVDDFVAILDRALAAGADVRGVLAGPAVGREVERFVRDKCASLGDRLEWRGPLSGEAKEQFFADIDSFVFPTRYRTEALPLVVAEALVRGVSVIAPARGCIGAFRAHRWAEIFPVDADIVTCACASVIAAAADPVIVRQGRASAREEGIKLNKRHLARQRELVQEIAAAARGANSDTGGEAHGQVS